MEHHFDFKTPTQAEIDKAIYQAHRMRSEYLVQSIKAGLSKLRGALVHKNPVRKTTA